MRRWFVWLVLSLAALACLVTAISAIRSNLWWIRILDFPRVAMLGAICAVAIGCLFATGRARIVALTGLVVAGGWQLWRIHDYTMLAPTEMALAGAGDPAASCFTAIGLNVLQKNRDHDRIIAALRAANPDLLLLMETDQRWAEALRPLLDTYPYKLQIPINNFGMIFASRLRIRAAHFAAATDANTPTLYSRLETREGEPFAFVGLHPQPPRPGQNTGARDRNIAKASRRTANDPLPALAMGDFNDVPWSHTTQLFKKTGGFLDPRAGRGAYATFPAQHRWLGWPLDQIFVTPAFRVRAVRVLEDVGSDHRPLLAELCLPRGQHAGTTS